MQTFLLWVGCDLRLIVSFFAFYTLMAKPAAQREKDEKKLLRKEDDKSEKHVKIWQDKKKG